MTKRIRRLIERGEKERKQINFVKLKRISILNVSTDSKIKKSKNQRSKR